MTHSPDRPAGNCPCLSGLSYDECCGAFHLGQADAPTAERLMRSRYSAYAVGDALYLLRTWHRSTRPATLVIDPDIRWTRLEIAGRTRGGLLDGDGTVEFRAYSRTGVVQSEQHENSRFVRENKLWFYVDEVG